MSWWRRLFRRAELERQLARELEFHVEAHAAELTARGVEPAEGRRLARLALGGPEQVKESCRDARGTRWVEDLLQDAGYAVRALKRAPGFAVAAICTLALGAGATTVMFTVIHGVLLKPLAYPEPQRLVTLGEQTDWSTVYGNRWAFAYPNFLDCQRDARTVTLGAWRFNGGTVSEPGEPEYVNSREISSALFPILRVAVSEGRSFVESDDRPGAAPVAIVSEAFRERHRADAPSTIGARLVFEGQPYTIVGVVPSTFELSGPFDVLTPLGQNTQPMMANRNIHPGIQVWGRLQPGATLAEARAELAVIGGRLAAQYPDSNRGRSFVADRLVPNVGDVGPTLWLLFGAVAIVLLIACANVASLLLARAVTRDRELAMRAALGAGRGRLVRQCLTESAVLGLAGGALGVAFAAAGVRPFVAFWPGSLPRAEEVRLDWPVLAFAVAVALASGVLFGLAPAWRVPARRLDRALRAGARTVAGGVRRLHASFIVAEVALAVVLLVSAGALARTLLRLSALEPGLDVHNVLVARMAVSPTLLATPDRARAAWQDALDRARTVPGVTAAAIVDTVPMREGNNQIGYSTTPDVASPDRLSLTLATSVSPDYLAVMGIPLRRGRFITDRDVRGRTPVIVIDEVLARQAFGGADPVGRRLWVPDLGRGAFEIVGVVGHVRHWGLGGDDSSSVRAQLYYPFAQLEDRFVRRWSELMSFAVRTTVTPGAVLPALQRELRGAAGDQVLYEVRTMEQLSRGSLDRQRFLLLLFGVFAAVALLLASIGVYGVLSYATSQRAREIGVRMALGSTTRGIIAMILGQSLRMLAGGIAIGTLGAAAAGRLLERFVEGAQPTEWSTFALMIGVLAFAALTASFVPAWRASRADALSALHAD